MLMYLIRIHVLRILLPKKMLLRGPDDVIWWGNLTNLLGFDHSSYEEPQSKVTEEAESEMVLGKCKKIEQFSMTHGLKKKTLLHEIKDGLYLMVMKLTRVLINQIS